METDKTTLADLGIFGNEDEISIFNKINFTLTSRGKEQLRKNLLSPLKSAAEIKNVQEAISQILLSRKDWPESVSNGTLMVVERFYDAQLDPIPERPSVLSAYTYKLLHSADYSLVKYSVKHVFDFISGMHKLGRIFSAENIPELLKIKSAEIEKILDRPELSIVGKKRSASDFTIPETLAFANFILYRFKRSVFELIMLYALIDAWYGMAAAVEKFEMSMPVFSESDKPDFSANGLYHLLLEEPITYNITLNRDKNFLFLTGANMAGKSTFIKSCGAAVYLAHTGMGVPAKEMHLSFYDGLLSNINVIDNIAKGESYFFNEVQRIRATIEKVSKGKNWFILIDELFKGTNIQDAMKCSTSVIEGLAKIKDSVFILSTHLYEISEDLSKFKNICFNYFETNVIRGDLHFSYQLKEGVSNDRLGYLILEKEGVVKMLNEIA